MMCHKDTIEIELKKLLNHLKEKKMKVKMSEGNIDKMEIKRDINVDD